MHLSDVVSLFDFHVFLFDTVQSLQDEQVTEEKKTEDVDHPLKSIEQVKTQLTCTTDIISTRSMI